MFAVISCGLMVGLGDVEGFFQPDSLVLVWAWALHMDVAGGR